MVTQLISSETQWKQKCLDSPTWVVSTVLCSLCRMLPEVTKWTLSILPLCRRSWRWIASCLHQSVHIRHPSPHGTPGGPCGSNTNGAHRPVPSKYMELWGKNPAWLHRLVHMFWLDMALIIMWVCNCNARGILLFLYSIVEPLKIDYRASIFRC